MSLRKLEVIETKDNRGHKDKVNSFMETVQVNGGKIISTNHTAYSREGAGVSNIITFIDYLDYSRVEPSLEVEHLEKQNQTHKEEQGQDLKQKEETDKEILPSERAPRVSIVSDNDLSALGVQTRGHVPKNY